MASRSELEKKPLFRFVKVVFLLFWIIIFLCTAGLMFVSKSDKIDTSEATFTCNYSGNKTYELNDSEKELLKDNKNELFDKGTPENTRLAKECYKDYSGGKDPELATRFDIQLFNEMESGSNGKVYVINGLRKYEDWHVPQFAVTFTVELIVFMALRFFGFYIFGGLEATRNNW